MRYVVLSGHRETARVSGENWVRLDDQTVLWSEAEEWAGPAGRAAREAQGRLYLVGQVGGAFEHAFPDVRPVVAKGRYLVVDLLPDQVERLAGHSEEDWIVRPLPENTVVLDTATVQARQRDPRVEAVLAQVSQSFYSGYLTHLAVMPTRHSLSPDFARAAEWAQGELQALGYQAEIRPVTVGSGTSANVVADRPGTGSGARDLVLVTAHLDSVNHEGGRNAPAPGADDNGSGAAAVLEIGRVLAAHAARHDLRLILFGGEEQGLFGSQQYVSGLPASERARIRAVINMDMIATRNTAAPTVLLEGATVSQALMQALAAAAATYTGLTVQTSLNPFNSDHVPFINALIPAVLTIEGADNTNTNVHSARDTLEHIDYGLALDIVRMNVAATVALLGGQGGQDERASGNLLRPFMHDNWRVKRA